MRAVRQSAPSPHAGASAADGRPGDDTHDAHDHKGTGKRAPVQNDEDDEGLRRHVRGLVPERTDGAGAVRGLHEHPGAVR